MNQPCLVVMGTPVKPRIWVLLCLVFLAGLLSRSTALMPITSREDEAKLKPPKHALNFDVPLPPEADAREAVRVLSAVVRQSMPESCCGTDAPCEVSLELRLPDSEVPDPVTELLDLSGMRDRKNASATDESSPSAQQQVHATIECSNSQGAPAEAQSALKSLVTGYLAKHGWSDPPKVSSHNPKLDDTQHPAEPVLARAVTRATVPQNPLELIQSWMHMKEGSSGAPVAALAIGLCVGLVVLVYLCWVVYRWLSSSNKEGKFMHVERTAITKKPRNLKEQSTAARLPATANMSSMKWKKEWGKPPLQLMEEHPDVDWSRYI